MGSLSCWLECGSLRRVTRLVQLVSAFPHTQLCSLIINWCSTRFQLLRWLLALVWNHQLARHRVCSPSTIPQRNHSNKLAYRVLESYTAGTENQLNDALGVYVRSTIDLPGPNIADRDLLSSSSGSCCRSSSSWVPSARLLLSRLCLVS